MKSLANAFLESVILQGVLAIMVVGTLCYMYATGQEVPDGLVGLAGIAVGFYFRTKAVIEGRREGPQ